MLRGHVRQSIYCRREESAGALRLQLERRRRHRGARRRMDRKMSAKPASHFVPFLDRLTPEQLARFRGKMVSLRRRFRRRMKRKANGELRGRAFEPQKLR